MTLQKNMKFLQFFFLLFAQLFKSMLVFTRGATFSVNFRGLLIDWLTEPPVDMFSESRHLPTNVANLI